MTTNVEKVTVLDEYDGFEIVVKFKDKPKSVRFRFSQEDNHAQLVKVFIALGIVNVAYEEVC